jgi:formylglycine-generating enzyme required for sulfatase activity
MRPGPRLSTALVIAAALFTGLRPPLTRLDASSAGVLQQPRANAQTKVDAGSTYRERISGTEVSFEMVAVPGGEIWPGSPEDETGRRGDEGPRRQVEVAPFWIGRHEVTWDEYRIFMYATDLPAPAPQGEGEGETLPEGVDAISRPTRPYVPMDFGMGVDGYPAVGMTHFAARQYTRWLSAKTGRFYRLPTEAEWEHACRAGTATAYSFGDDTALLRDHAWYFENSPDRYQPVGTRLPNPWGIYDLHGNVAEWVIDQHAERYPMDAPVAWPTAQYPHVVRGGSFLDDAPDLRCAARRASSPGWKRRDPQLPQSIWYLTDARFVGFRVVHPLAEPSESESERWWGPDTEEERRILERQERSGQAPERSRP